MERINALEKQSGRRTRKMLQKNASIEQAALISHLLRAKKDAENLALVINFVNDPLVLEDLIYKLKAAQTRFRYCLQQARSAGVRARNLELISANEL